MERLKLFCALGRRLEALKPETEVVRQAAAENPWFSPREICRAAGALAERMLVRERLTEWLARYPALPAAVERRVRIVMAGNIPMVGFFDLLCVLAAGHRAVVKYSGKDRTMMRWVAGQLLEMEPELPLEEERGQETDAVIATGGENANRYFRTQYAGLPTLLRGSRQSVAVLAGDERPDELAGLADDLFAYSGLGCRNVSLLFVPRGFVPTLTVPPMNEAYRSNYRQQKALLTVAGRSFTDLGGALLLEQSTFPAALSTIALATYDDLSEVERWIAEHDTEIQCVVSRCIGHSRRVDFGRAQSPGLTDYPDAADVMEFLSKI